MLEATNIPVVTRGCTRGAPMRTNVTDRVWNDLDSTGHRPAGRSAVRHFWNWRRADNSAVADAARGDESAARSWHISRCATAARGGAWSTGVLACGQSGPASLAPGCGWAVHWRVVRREAGAGHEPAGSDAPVCRTVVRGCGAPLGNGVTVGADRLWGRALLQPDWRRV